MPGESTLVLKTTKTFQPKTPRGRIQILETTGNDNSPLSGGFDGITGTTLYTTNIADISSTQSAALVLDNAQTCPGGCAAYLQNLRASVNGATAWTATTTTALAGIVIEDTLGVPLAIFTVQALQAYAQLAFPANQTVIALTPTVSSYAAGTGVMTFPASTFSGSNSVKGTIGQVVGGTGVGQTFVVSANTTTTVTPVGGSLATALDSTSVVSFPYWVTTGAVSTATYPISNGTFPTTLIATSGYYLVAVSGTQAGQYAPITGSTATSLTATFGTALPSGTTFVVTTNPQLFGSIDFSIASQLNVATINQGVQAAILNVAGGSNVRLQWEGFFSDPQ